MAMDVMGIRDDELLEGVEFGGAASYIAEAIESKITLFIQPQRNNERRPDPLPLREVLGAGPSGTLTP